MCELLDALGVRMRKVEDLEEGKLYVPDRKLLLLDVDMTLSQISAAIDRILPEAFAHRRGSTRQR